MAAAQKDFKAPIVTEIKPLDAFYPAEKYHQDFYKNNPSYPYSEAVIAPKLEKFRKTQKAE
jgi:peptide-methionine (S)-S-oxide reductase